jgi:hypothetical protein
LAARAIAAVLVETTAVWDMHLLGSWQPWVKGLLFLASTVAVLGTLLAADVRRVSAATLVASMVALAGGSTAYAVSTADHPHTGSIPSAGPVTTGGGAGGPGDAGSADRTLTDLLAATTSRWAAATTGAQSAAGLQIASGAAVMAIGGFTGSDDAPTLAAFQAWVRAGEVSYYIGTGSGTGFGGAGFGGGGFGGGGFGGGGFGGGGFGGGPGGGGSAGQIASWVAANYTARSVGGQTVYDLRS